MEKKVNLRKQEGQKFIPQRVVLDIVGSRKASGGLVA